MAVLLPLALVHRRRWAIAAALVPLAIFLLLYGGLFLPRFQPGFANGAEVLRVMTWNILYTNDDGAAIARRIEGAEPDVICFQELVPAMAADLIGRLGDEYPYRVLLVENDVTGLGVFSRYPLRDEGEVPDPAWKHGAQVVAVEFEGESALLLNVHAVSSWLPLGARGRASFEWTFRLREEQVRRWMARVDRHDGPVVVAGDFNLTDQNAAYRPLDASLDDAFRRAGRGWGHTFPADAEQWRGIPVPRRLWRLDYVWYSDHWQALEAHVGPWDGQSDHLPIVADLVLP